MRRFSLFLLPFCCLLPLALPETASAHPLGNFTINHYARLEIQPAAIRLRYVLDEAEIPTYQELAMLHPGGGKPTAQEEQTFLAARVELLRSNLHLTVAGQPLALEAEPGTSSLNFPTGQGGLSLLRITVWFRATLPDAATAPLDATFRDDNDRDRLGWKEIVVRAAGASLLQSSATSVDQSDELRSYPQDMLSSPLDVQSAQFTFTPAADSAGRSGAIANLLRPRGRSAGILQASSDAFTALVSRQALSPLFTAIALLAAVALGGLHALSPGHGKTIVGAYLIGSRGTPRHAAILGVTVTLTHTVGVFALGLITLFASRFVLPERLYPWLSALSGLLVAAVGGWLLWARLRWAFHQHAHTEAKHGHGTVMIAHDHGTGPHEHVVPASSQVTLRGLLALGISGGLLPCPSALVVLLAAISLHRVAFGIVLVLAFSAGLAIVLTGIGLLLVYARGFLTRHRLEFGPGRLLPAASACLVLLLGLGIAFQALAQGGLRLL